MMKSLLSMLVVVAFTCSLSSVYAEHSKVKGLAQQLTQSAVQLQGSLLNDLGKRDLSLGEGSTQGQSQGPSQGQLQEGQKLQCCDCGDSCQCEEGTCPCSATFATALFDATQKFVRQAHNFAQLVDKKQSREVQLQVDQEFQSLRDQFTQVQELALQFRKQLQSFSSQSQSSCQFFDQSGSGEQRFFDQGQQQLQRMQKTIQHLQQEL
ncbi:MAG: hypothetical protein HQK50_16170 [Oligoflexia bacterium]|nr:hypothetical protein [Oligoflexia bacterium]MBF0367112.1 hypothetical protein [Oligoflexia bacterium]